MRRVTFREYVSNRLVDMPSTYVGVTDVFSLKGPILQPVFLQCCGTY